MSKLKNTFAEFEKVSSAKKIEFQLKKMLKESKHNISFAELYIMIVISYLEEYGSDYFENWQEDDITVQMITDFGWTNNVSMTADKLVSKNLIARESCPRDRRYVYFQLTEEGNDFLKGVEQVIDALTGD